MTQELTAEQQLEREAIITARSDLARREQEFAESTCPHKVGEIWVSKNGYRARAKTIRYAWTRPYYQVYGVILRSNGTETDKKVHLTDLFAGWRKQ